MRKIVLDCGGHCGESIQKFVKTAPGYDYYTFEANPDLLPIICRVVSELDVPVFIYPGAVWTYDGHLDFFVGHDQGSTALSGKVEYADGIQQVNYKVPITVPCIDLSSWIIRNTNQDDEVVVKMDIEGGEYEVLPKMIADGSLERVSVLFCEWHHDRFPNISVEFHNQLVEKIEKITLLRDWA